MPPHLSRYHLHRATQRTLAQVLSLAAHTVLVMMGYNHATMTMIAGVLTIPLVQPASGIDAAVWVIECGGFGLLADLDHPKASVARMWGPVTEALAHIVTAVSRGHRWGTHDLLLAPPLAYMLFTYAARSYPTRLFALALAIGLALRAVTMLGGTYMGAGVNAGVSWVGAWWMLEHVASADTHLPFAAALGIISHILGDSITKRKVPVPIVWIWTKERFGLPLLTTNSRMERNVIAPALTSILLVSTWYILDPQTRRDVIEVFPILRHDWISTI
ncbi:hypothetical protein KEM60_02698 [Austwickia sp. TVS 96-490-7B]|nr:hypothetical protein [Austwickia sp. TVS 96-490-7B]